MDGTMTLSEYAAIEELKGQHRNGWGSTTALWVLVAAIIIFAIVYNWTKGCNEKVAFATALSDLNGRIKCIEPTVRQTSENVYRNHGVVSALKQGVSDMYDNFGNQLDNLNEDVFYNRRRRGDCGCGSGCGRPNRVFAQTSTYAPKETEVTVTETCGNDRY